MKLFSWLSLGICGFLGSCYGDEFFYASFNSTEGLNFNGNASVTDFGCSQAFSDQIILRRKPDEKKMLEEVVSQYECSLDEKAMIKQRYQISNWGWDVLNTSESLELFSHEDQKSFLQEDRERFCGLKLQLTSPESHQTGSVFRNVPVKARAGFTSWFSFSVPNSTEVCLMKDNVEANCLLDGAHGFSFILHSDEKTKHAIGNGAKGLGFEGIEGALAIAFDIHFDPELDDVPHDVMNVFASKSEEAISLTTEDRLVNSVAMVNRHQFNQERLKEELSIDLFKRAARKLNITVGREHYVKIEYYSFINFDFFDLLEMASGNERFLKSGEDVGTLVIYVDNDEPSVVLLVSFDKIFGENDIYVGFTAATGKLFARHLINSWRFVETTD